MQLRRHDLKSAAAARMRKVRVCLGAEPRSIVQSIYCTSFTISAVF